MRILRSFRHTILQMDQATQISVVQPLRRLALRQVQASPLKVIQVDLPGYSVITPMFQFNFIKNIF